jgi:dTMP kinase
MLPFAATRTAEESMDNAHIPGGLLIVIEGIDGAGKTTLAHALAATLREQGGLSVVISKEPTHGPHGTALRNTAATGRLSPQDELALLVADRREHVEQLIAPALAAGQVVILDRYYFSNLAYQGAEGLALDEIRASNAFAPAPDLLLLLDLPVTTGLQRIAVRGDVANAFETASTLEAVRQLFLDIVPPPPRAAVLDAAVDAASVRVRSLHLVIEAIDGKCAAAGIPLAPRLLQLRSSLTGLVG